MKNTVTDDEPEKGCPMGFNQVETDIGLAMRCRVPVLITAQADRALAVARAIATGGNTPRSLTVCDGAIIVDAARHGWPDHATIGDERVIVVHEVQALNDVEQAALLQLLDAADVSGFPRILATSSASLFDHVRAGQFNEGLFYRLNVVHIRMCDVARVAAQ